MANTHIEWSKINALATLKHKRLFLCIPHNFIPSKAVPKYILQSMIEILPEPRINRLLQLLRIRLVLFSRNHILVQLISRCAFDNDLQYWLLQIIWVTGSLFWPLSCARHREITRENERKYGQEQEFLNTTYSLHKRQPVFVREFEQFWVGEIVHASIG